MNLEAFLDASFLCQFSGCLKLEFWLEFSCPGLQCLGKLVSPGNVCNAKLAVGVCVVQELLEVLTVGVHCPFGLVVHVPAS
jgi:hypothetical protein